MDKYEWVGQTTRVNPWGDLAGVDEVAEALKNSSQHSLALLAHEQNHAYHMNS